MTRPISKIAFEIRDEILAGNWSKKASHYAAPYIQAMYHLNSINDKYILDSGRDIVLRFLCNAASWRGETARRIKAELNAIVKEDR